MKLFFVFVAVLSLACHAQTMPGTPSSWFNIRNFGVIADGKTSDTKAIQRAIDSCAAAGGGTVLVPPGSYVTGTLWLKSNITLNLDAGATLLGSDNKDEFPEWISDWEGPSVPREFKRYAPLLAGENLENVSIVGRGTIDARGEPWWQMQRAAKSGK